jgi:hypothetical protein
MNSSAIRLKPDFFKKKLKNIKINYRKNKKKEINLEVSIFKIELGNEMEPR